MPDAGQLLQMCQQGDEEALAMIVRQYEKPFYRLALRVCFDSALAEDAATESFYKIWKYAYQFSGQANAESWMYRIVTRTAIDLHRKQSRWRIHTAPPPTDHPSQEQTSLGNTLEKEKHEHLKQALDQAMDTLSPQDRALVYLYYLEQQPLKQISTILEASTDALKMRLARTRKRLRQHLEANHEFT